MILYTDGNEKVRCTKTPTPKIRGKNKYLWDSLERKIDDIKTKFCFTVKNNRSYFYFFFEENWYKTEMVTEEGMDLWHYFEEERKDLYTQKREVL